MDQWFTDAVIVFLMFSSADASLIWKTATNPLVIGEEAILSCNGNNCLPQYSKKWYGGKYFDLLCSDDNSCNSSKYEMTRNGSTFDLIIKKLNLSDFNFEYTCACGFQKYTNTLRENSEELIYPPKVLENSLEQTGMMLHIDVLVAVHPSPNCTLFYEDTVLSANITVCTVPNSIELRLFEVLLRIVVPRGSFCNGNITLHCIVRSHTYLVYRHKLDHCEDEANSKKVIYICIGFGTIIFVLLVLRLILFGVDKYSLYRNGQNRNTYKRSEDGENEYLNLQIIEKHIIKCGSKEQGITIVEAQNANVMKRIEGQSVTLTCIVFGTPLGETLYLTTENKILASNDTNYVTYTFTAQRSHNMEEFMCNSNSSFGSDQATVKLILMIRPVTPINMQCVALYTEIIVKWQAGCSDVQQQTFLVEYQHRFQSKWSTVYSENTTSLTIHGLKQDMVYFVRMFARTEAGDSNKTKEIIAKTGKRPSYCYTLEFAVSLVGILSVILVCWCWRNGSKYIPCRNRNQCRIISSGENDTAQDRAGPHYDEIESIQFDTESPIIIPEGNIIPSEQHEQVKPSLTSHNDNVLEHTNSIFVLNINGETEKSPHVTGKKENRKYSGGSTSEESHLVQNRQCIDISDVDEGQNESREECVANGNDSPTSRKSQKSDSETELKSIRKYESLVQTNTVEHYIELSAVKIHNI